MDNTGKDMEEKITKNTTLGSDPIDGRPHHPHNRIKTVHLRLNLEQKEV